MSHISNEQETRRHGRRVFLRAAMTLMPARFHNPDSPSNFVIVTTASLGWGILRIAGIELDDSSR